MPPISSPRYSNPVDAPDMRGSRYLLASQRLSIEKSDHSPGYAGLIFPDPSNRTGNTPGCSCHGAPFWSLPK